MKPLYEGEKYVDPLRIKLQQEAEKKKGLITDNPFKMVNPMKKSTGKGDYYSTFSKNQYIVPVVQKNLQKGDIGEGMRGIFTQPGKKGTFGFIKTTLSEREAGPKGIAGEAADRHCIAANCIRSVLSIRARSAWTSAHLITSFPGGMNAPICCSDLAANQLPAEPFCDGTGFSFAK